MLYFVGNSLNGRRPRRKIIVKESVFGDSVKIQGQCERQKDVSESEYVQKQ